MFRDDISSADEDTKKRVDKKTNRQKLFNRTHDHAVNPPLPGLDTQAIKSPVVKMTQQAPDLMDTKEMLAQFKHVNPKRKLCEGQLYKDGTIQHHNMDPDLLTKCFAAADVSKSHLAQSKINPYQCILWKEKFNRLTVPQFYAEQDLSNGLDQQQLNDMLRLNRLELPVMDAGHESLILAQGGICTDADGVERNFPLCSAMDKCVGCTSTIPGLTEATILMAMMYEVEYKKFIEQGIAPPGNGRLCVLCYRYRLSDWTLYCRDLRMLAQGDGMSQSTNEAWKMKSMQIMQIYFNKVNTQGGYDASFCILPEPREPIIQPIVRLARTKLFAYKKNGRTIIDQSALVWKPPTVPVPINGESVKHFC